ncbi:MAG TPA: tripartite tricarboxylate transporter substrate binding protein [Burkholderiales bacterium]|jgi:tripartite-type tricarboxylate transporter receptor subunit TctC|nr:tripartite tricarboxylate transporter substrate binding protein [Burkholderiales bacterium]
MMKIDRRSYLGICVCLAVPAACLLAVPAIAQESWPSRPVRVVVPSSPGGGTDTFARLLAQGLSEELKQQFVIDNRPGASGNIGTDAVAKAQPDGYTVLVSASAAVAINPGLYRNLPFNVERDLQPVARGVDSPMIYCANPSLDVKTLGELVALGKRTPGTTPFASAGTGSTTYLGVKMVEEVTGARFLHVPYKGVGPAYQDLLGGQVKFMFTDLASVQQYIKAGRVLALAINEHSPLLPQVPTVAQAGISGVEISNSFSVLLPAGTPPAIVKRLSDATLHAMKAADIGPKLEAQALVPVFDTPETFSASLKKERTQWAAFIKRNGIVQEQ